MREYKTERESLLSRGSIHSASGFKSSLADVEQSHRFMSFVQDVRETSLTARNRFQFDRSRIKYI